MTLIDKTKFFSFRRKKIEAIRRENEITKEMIDKALDDFLEHEKEDPEYACFIANGIIATLYQLYLNE